MTTIPSRFELMAHEVVTRIGERTPDGERVALDVARSSMAGIVAWLQRKQETPAHIEQLGLEIRQKLQAHPTLLRGANTHLLAIMSETYPMTGDHYLALSDGLMDIRARVKACQTEKQKQSQLNTEAFAVEDSGMKQAGAPNTPRPAPHEATTR